MCALGELLRETCVVKIFIVFQLQLMKAHRSARRGIPDYRVFWLH